MKPTIPGSSTSDTSTKSTSNVPSSDKYNFRTMKNADEIIDNILPKLDSNLAKEDIVLLDNILSDLSACSCYFGNFEPIPLDHQSETISAQISPRLSNIELMLFQKSISRSGDLYFVFSGYCESPEEEIAEIVKELDDEWDAYWFYSSESDETVKRKTVLKYKILCELFTDLRARCDDVWFPVFLNIRKTIDSVLICENDNFTELEKFFSFDQPLTSNISWAYFVGKLCRILKPFGIERDKLRHYLLESYEFLCNNSAYKNDNPDYCEKVTKIRSDLVSLGFELNVNVIEGNTNVKANAIGPSSNDVPPASTTVGSAGAGTDTVSPQSSDIPGSTLSTPSFDDLSPGTGGGSFPDTDPGSTRKVTGSTAQEILDDHTNIQDRSTLAPSSASTDTGLTGGHSLDATDFSTAHPSVTSDGTLGSDSDTLTATTSTDASSKSFDASAFAIVNKGLLSTLIPPVDSVQNADIVSKFDALQEALKTLISCIQSSDENIVVYFVRFIEEIVNVSDFKCLLTGYVCPCSYFVRQLPPPYVSGLLREIPDRNTSLYTSISNVQKVWTVEKLQFLSLLFTKLHECWTEPLSRLLVKIRETLPEKTDEIKRYFSFEYGINRDQYITFLGDLCYLVNSDKEQDIRRVNEMVTVAFKLLRSHARYDTDAKYKDKVNEIRQGLIDLSFESIVRQVEASQPAKSSTGSTNGQSDTADPTTIAEALGSSPATTGSSSSSTITSSVSATHPDSTAESSSSSKSSTAEDVPTDSRLTPAIPSGTRVYSHSDVDNIPDTHTLTNAVDESSGGTVHDTSNPSLTASPITFPTTVKSSTASNYLGSNASPSSNVGSTPMSVLTGSGMKSAASGDSGSAGGSRSGAETSGTISGGSSHTNNSSTNTHPSTAMTPELTNAQSTPQSNDALNGSTVTTKLPGSETSPTCKKRYVIGSITIAACIAGSIGASIYFTRPTDNNSEKDDHDVHEFDIKKPEAIKIPNTEIGSSNGHTVYLSIFALFSILL